MPKAILAEQGGKGSSGEGFTLLKIDVTSQPQKTTYLAGDTFSRTGMVVTASYGITGVVIATNPVTNYTCNPEVLKDGDTKVTITYSELGVTVKTTVSVTVNPKLTSITCTNPQKMTYEYGDTLSTTGAVVTAHYSNNTSKTVTGTFSPTQLNTVGQQKITVSYSENSITQTTSFTVTVERKRVPVPSWKEGSLTYDGNPKTCTNASYWNNYNATYMSASGDVTKTIAGTYTVVFTPTANYQWADVASPTTGQSCQWKIDRQKIATKPTWKANLTYTGSPQEVSATTYWNNYNPVKMTIGGTLSRTTAGSEDATFTPTDNYCWSDGSITTVTVQWTINKAAGSLTLSPTSVSLSSSSYQKTVTANKHGSTGALSYTSLDGCTISISGTSITITGNRTTAINSKSITITMAADTNYTQATATITVTASYWTWGEDTATGDATWWAGLKAAITSGQSGASYVGRKKFVSLNKTVAGWTTKVQMTCIGYNIDGNNTLTFQTTYCSPSTIANFHPSVANWENSTAQSLCNDFASACSASNSLKSVQIQWCSASNGNQNNTADKTFTCKCFLPSVCQMGWTSDNSYASSYEEWTVGGSKKPYPVYTDNASRVKYSDKADGSAESGSTAWYWLRSRRYYYSGYVCRVHSDGSPGDDAYDGSSGRLAPAFVIG